MMSKILVDRALIEQAVEALTKSVLFCNHMGVGDWQPTAMACHSGIAALRAKLAEPAVEPVAWVLSHSQGIEFSSKYPMQKSRDAAEQMARQHMGVMTVTPIYTSAPPPAEPAVEPVPLLAEVLTALDDAAVLADFAECWITDPAIEGMKRLKNGGEQYRALSQKVRGAASPPPPAQPVVQHLPADDTEGGAL